MLCYTTTAASAAPNKLLSRHWLWHCSDMEAGSTTAAAQQVVRGPSCGM